MMAITKKLIKDVKFEDFDPNNFTQADEVWAIYDGHTFRTLGSRGPALSAVRAAHRAKLYFMEPSGHWREVAVKSAHRPTDRGCDWCDGDVAGNWGYPWVYEKFGGKIPPGPDGVRLLYLCGTCRAVNG
jgi:hypothetical protein